MIIPEPVFIDRAFHDVDVLAESTRGYDLDILQLDRARFHGRILQWITPQLIVTRGTFNCRLQQTGQPPPGYRTFVVPMNDAMQLLWRGHHITGNHLLLFPDGSDLFAASGDHFDVYTVSIRESGLLSATCGAEQDRLARLLHTAEILSLPFASIHRFRKCLLQLERVRFAFCPASAGPPSDIVHRALLELIREATAETSRRSSAMREAAVRRIRTQVLARPDTPPAIGDIGRAIGASQRTLNYAFREYFGMTAKAYVNRVRLNAVRRSLRAAACGAGVADAANAWGFWHMGQFAADYRKAFGENPSDTLAASRDTVPGRV